MNPFYIVAANMLPTTENQFFIQALINLAGDDYSSGWSAGMDKKKFVVDFFKTRFGGEHPVYTKVASTL